MLEESPELGYEVALSDENPRKLAKRQLFDYVVPSYPVIDWDDADIDVIVWTSNRDESRKMQHWKARQMLHLFNTLYDIPIDNMQTLYNDEYDTYSIGITDRRKIPSTEFFAQLIEDYDDRDGDGEVIIVISDLVLEVLGDTGFHFIPQEDYKFKRIRLPKNGTENPKRKRLRKHQLFDYIVPKYPIHRWEDSYTDVSIWNSNNNESDATQYWKARKVKHLISVLYEIPAGFVQILYDPEEDWYVVGVEDSDVLPHKLLIDHLSDKTGSIDVIFELMEDLGFHFIPEEKYKPRQIRLSKTPPKPARGALGTRRRR